MVDIGEGSRWRVEDEAKGAGVVKEIGLPGWLNGVGGPRDCLG